MRSESGSALGDVMSGEVDDLSLRASTYPIHDTIQQSLPLPPSGGAGGGDSPVSITSRAAPPVVPRLSRIFKGGIIEKPQQERLFKGWDITAGGVKPKACGEEDVLWFCEACGHWFKTPRVCKERTCPTCGIVWAHEKGSEMAFRMKAVGRTPQARGAWGREVIISPPTYQHARLLKDDKYVKYKRTQVYEVAKRIGVRGGGAVFHPFRKDHETDHYEVDGPHYHVVGWCDKLKPMNARSMKRLRTEGWIWWGTTNADGRTAKRYRSWAMWYDKCQYELSHCAIIPGMQAYTWFGICNHKIVPLSKDEIEIRRESKGNCCPDCGSKHTTPQGLACPDREIDRRPHTRFAHDGQSRFKIGVWVRRGHRTPL